MSDILDQLNEPAVPIVINPNGSLMAVASLGAGTNITVGSSYRID